MQHNGGGSAGRRRCRPRFASGTTPDDRRKNSTGPESSCWRSRCFRRCWPRWPWRKEGEQKTILQVYVSSISAHEFLLGKILTFMVVAFCECLLLLTLLFTYFGLNFAGDPTPFIVATILYAFCVSSFGTLIGVRHPQPGGGHAGGGAGRLSAGLHALRLDFSHPEHSGPDPLALELRLGPVLHRHRARRAAAKAAAGPRCGGRFSIIGFTGSVFYTMAWRNMRRMQLKA